MIAIIEFEKTNEYEIAHMNWIKRDKKKTVMLVKFHYSIYELF